MNIYNNEKIYINRYMFLRIKNFKFLSLWYLNNNYSLFLINYSLYLLLLFG